MMTPRRAAPPAVLALLIFPPLLAAPAAADEQPGDVELTASAAWRYGGSFDRADGGELDIEDGGGFALAANFRAEANTQWEVYYSRQSSEFTTGDLFAGTPVVDVDVDYFHGGGTYIVQGGNVRPYVVMTLGISRFAPADAEDAELDDETFFSASLGAGLRIAAGERMAFRLEARAFTSFVDSDSNLFCVAGGSDNVCLLEAGGSTVTQWQATAGLTLKF
ncbi:MAG TPA: outer membrane beta-barrel protein [Woeseiaceae bacterium]|nr:outer membrane beta-barrel protein [Woeseiaceae bacterium]